MFRNGSLLEKNFVTCIHVVLQCFHDIHNMAIQEIPRVYSGKVMESLMVFR